MAIDPMRVSLSVTIDVKTIGDSLLASRGQIARVNRLVVNKIVRDVKRFTGSAQPKHTGSNVAGFKRVRVKSKALILKKNRTFGSVWVGGSSIQARFGGRLRNVVGGAMAGKHFFADAFVATVRKSRSGGFTSIWYRKGGKLVQAKYDVVDFEPVNKQSLAKATVNVDRFLRSELQRVLFDNKGVRGFK